MAYIDLSFKIKKGIHSYTINEWEYAPDIDIYYETFLP